jgi:5-methylcytosine-specific restriction endonuclease McrA
MKYNVNIAKSDSRKVKKKEKKVLQAKRKERKEKKAKNLSDRQVWSVKLAEKLKPIHRASDNRAKVLAERVLKRIDSAKNGMVTRSNKKNIECTVTIEQLRELVFEAYGKTCRYCKKRLDVTTYVFDHIIPVSQGGGTTVENLQVICKTSNNAKGAMSAEHFDLLLEWLKTVPEELSKSILCRLAGGLR